LDDNPQQPRRKKICRHKPFDAKRQRLAEEHRVAGVRGKGGGNDFDTYRNTCTRPTLFG